MSLDNASFYYYYYIHLVGTTTIITLHPTITSSPLGIENAEWEYVE